MGSSSKIYEGKGGPSATRGHETHVQLGRATSMPHSQKLYPAIKKLYTSQSTITPRERWPVKTYINQAY